MSIKLFLNLGAGNLNSGFDRINSRLEIDDALVAQTQASLPGNSELQDLHYQWQFCYAAYYENCVSPLRNDPDSIEIDRTGITGFSVSSFAETTTELAREMRQWLDTSSFGEISTQLHQHLIKTAEVVIIIESTDDRIYRLPWHYWRAIADYPQAKITFSLNSYQRQASTSHRTKPRILAIFGDSTGIDTAADAKFIQQLHADLVTLTAPSIDRFRQNLTCPQGWDLLFFAGHSSDNSVGAIDLNPTESVTLTDLSDALQTAIERGLKLAIFNCCSGLGLATSLAQLNLPTAIVMREAVPNRIAQDFLQTFLHSFQRGNSVLIAVAAARQHLQSLEADFPCASWLPVVFWNPTVALPTWKSFYPQPPARIDLWQLAGTILATTAAIWGVRSQGYLEPLELGAYDLAMNSRPVTESIDDRILIIGINRQQPLSDRVLFQALTKLQQYRPRAIGLDIYRDRSFGEGHQDLTTLLRQQNSIIGSCLMSGTSKSFPGVAAPSGVQPERVGFTNFSLDRDGTIRRQVLGMAAVDRGCTTDHALSLRLALKYLGITAADETENGNIKIGSRELTVLPTNFGGYRSTTAQANLRGFQLMLNYRNAPQVAPELSLDDLLTQPVNPRSIAGKVVLIGYMEPGTGDTFWGVSKIEQIPGVTIHAQMTSNILSQILDNRSSISTWGDLGELGWILLWGGVGGVIWFRLTGVQIWIVGAGATIVLITSYGLYFNIRSVWTPLVPAGMSLIITPLAAMGANRWRLGDRASNS